MQPSNNKMRARNLLVEVLLLIAAGESCWYTITGDTDHEYSLARRLGFFLKEDYYAFLIVAGLASNKFHPKTKEKEISINTNEWHNMINGLSTTSDTKYFELTTSKIDRPMAHKGRNQRRNRRYNYHVLRIGHYNETTYNLDDEIGWGHLKFSTQLKARVGHQRPPTVPKLSSLQRAFRNNVREMITDVISTDAEFYDNLSHENLEPVDDDDDDDDAAADDNDDDEEDDCKQPPEKKAKTTTTLFSLEGVEGGIVGEAEAADFVSKLNLQQLNMLLAKMHERKHAESNDNLVITYPNVRNNKTMQYLKVPINKIDATNESFIKQANWIDRALEINCGTKDETTMFKSAKRTSKYLWKSYRDATEKAMEELNVLPQEKMNAVKMVAMFKAGSIRSRHQRRALLRHLRHHFGKHAFETERNVQLLCEGHTEVKAAYIMYEKIEGEKKERVDYQQKNIADEVAAQLTRELNHRGIVDPTRIVSIDVMAGGDHGKGAFIFGAKIVVILSSEEDHDEIDWEASFDFEISVAEIVCGKDSADLIALTIKDELTKGLRTIAKEELSFSVSIDSNGSSTISCSYSPPTNASATKSINADIFIVGDLAFYGMALGKEGMSGKWCHLCKMAAAQMADLNASSEAWKGIDEMKQVAVEYKKKLEAWEAADKKPKTPPQPKLGMKDEPWWDFIPLDHYIVPLLHCEIGIGDIILSKFRDFVSEHIEYISQDEAQTRAAKESMEEKIKALQAQRDAYKGSSDGKKLESLKAKRRRGNKELVELGAIEQMPGIAKASSTKELPLPEYLNNVTLFVEDGVKGEDGLEGTVDDNEVNATPAAPPAPAAAAAATAPASQDESGARIKELEQSVANCNKEIEQLEKALKSITSRVDTGKKYIAGLKEKIKEFKNGRKRSGDGIESEMMAVLKMFGIELQAYHGGSLHGKDVQKLMNHAHEIFTEFARILKESKKEGCTYGDDQIDAICLSYARLSILWDGAFSCASKTNPTKSDIDMYQRFITAAVNLHVELDLNVTPKVHLMWKHVAAQMLFDGGLGPKREDWGERAHQDSSKVRVQFRTTKNIEVRGESMARLRQQETHPEVVAHNAQVDADACRGPRKNYILKDEQRKKERQAKRKSVLEWWENKYPGKAFKPEQQCDASSSSKE